MTSCTGEVPSCCALLRRADRKPCIQRSTAAAALLQAYVDYWAEIRYDDNGTAHVAISRERTNRDDQFDFKDE